MTSQQKPRAKPNNPRFSSGPCTKRPGWTPNAVANALLGRSHRSQDGKARLKLAIERTRQLLDLPADFVVGIVPGSDTGAFEMAMWSLLGPRAVDVLAWESFGKGWATDVLKQLQLNNVRLLEADYGDLPDLKKVDWERDVIFTWNGTTSGVRVPNGDWIPSARKGLTFIDATSAIFAQPIDWSKADIVTYSWQKVLGGEAAHGMLILSPRAIERLESYDPPWPVPKLFRLKKDGKPNAAIFSGETINTPSMLCVEDYLDTLDWASSVGGAKGLMARADANAAVVFDWIERTPWIENLASDSTTRSNTSVCLKITDPEIASLSAADQTAFIKRMTSRLEHEAAAFDIAAHRDAPPGLRIWTGATVEKSDLEAVLPWLEWAFIETKTNS